MPVIAMPPMMCFWPMRKASTQGIVTTTEAAMTRFHLEVYLPTRLYRPTATVYFSMVFR